MRTPGTWQSKKNVSSKLNSIEQGPQNGDVEKLDSSLDSKPIELFISMTIQSKDIQDVHIHKEASLNLESKLASQCPKGPRSPKASSLGPAIYT